MKVYQAISAVQSALAKRGIEKNRKNIQQGFAFRGIDDVYAALAPLLSEYQLVILPQVLSREVTERQTAKGGTLIYTTLRVRYDFISAEDGSREVVIVDGEAMDSGDKSTNKAMSAAYKYACLQAFCIPTEGDNDADASTPAPVVPRDGTLASGVLWTVEEENDFITRVGELGFQAPHVAAWAVSISGAHPSVMGAERRNKLLGFLATDKGKVEAAKYITAKFKETE